MNGPGESRASHERWLVLFLLCLMYLITYLDRVSMANTASMIIKEYGFSKVQMGIIFSAFIWSYSLFQVPGGWLGDRFGPRKVLSTIMGYRTVIALVTTLSIGFKSFWAVRFALGVGEAGAFPTATRAMQMWYPRDERGFVQGISHAASRFGAAIGPPVAVAIMIHYGWRSVFYVIGALSLLWSILYMVVYRNMPEEHTPGHPRRTGAHPRPGRQRRNQKSQRGQAARKCPGACLLKHGNMWAVMCAYAAYIYSLWFFLSWLPSYLLEYRKFTLIKTGFYASLPLAAGVVGDAFGGWLTDKLYIKTNNLKFSRRSVAITAMLGCGTSTLFAALSASPFHGAHFPDHRDVLPGNDHRPRVGRPHGYRRRIFRHRLRDDEHGRAIRGRAVAHCFRISGFQGILGRPVRRFRGPAVHRRGHLGVLDRSGTIGH